MLVDDHVIERGDDGRWVLAVDADAIDVPPSIQSLLGARVERLPADELRTLELASVIGAEFSVGALRALGAAGGDATIAAVLDRLRRRELVEPTGNYWGDEPVHRFHHVLIRDAVYRRLLKGTRASLHQQIGDWLAAQTDRARDDELAVAFHFEQAHRYLDELGVRDADTDALGRSAAGMLRDAAQRALDADDLASGGALARRALELLPPTDERARLELLRVGCECLISAGDAAAGAPLADEYTALAHADPVEAAWASCFKAQLTGFTDPDGLIDAERAANLAANKLRELGDGAGEAKAHQVRALLLARLGRVGEAEGVLDQALAAARAAEDRRRVTAVLGAAPQAALFGPSPVARAGGRCLDVVRLLRITAASPSVEATSMRCQAVLEALRGRFDVARSMLDAARTTVEELGLRHGLLETDLFAGMVELLAGDAGAAVAPLRAAYDGLGTLGVGADAGQAAALLAHAYLELGDIDAADRYATASEELAGQNLKTAIAWRVARARVLAARGDVAAAVAMAQHAVEMAAGTDLTLDHADACAALAMLREQAGDGGGARGALAEARRLYEAKGATSSSTLLGVGVTTPSAQGPKMSPAFEMLDTLAARTARQSVETEVIAVRGEHLVLTRESNKAGTALRVVEVDGAANVAQTHTFDASELQAALDLLEARYEALRGDDYSPVERAILASARLVRERGFDAWIESLAPGFETHDWKPLGAGDQSEEGTATLVGDLYERVPDLVIVDAARRVSRDAHLSLMRFIGTTSEGADYSPTQWAVYHYDAELRLQRVDVFDEAQYDDALACFEGSGAWGPQRPAPHEAILDTLAARAVGRTADVEVLAVRGEHLVLTRHGTVLQLTEVDDGGRVVRNERFEESDLIDAYELLDAWHAARLGVGYSTVERAVVTWSTANNRRRWDSWAEMVAPGFTSRDWRILGSGEQDREAVLGLLAGGVEVMPNLVYVHAYIRTNDDACLTLPVGYGTSPEGGDYHDSFWHVAHVDADMRCRRIDMFDLDHYDDALACFEGTGRWAQQSAAEHDPTESLRLDNLATRNTTLFVEYANAGRLEEFPADWHRPDYVHIDHRFAGLGDGGSAEWLVAARMYGESGVESGSMRPIAVRGARLAVNRIEMNTSAGDSVAIACVVATDEDGRAERAEVFDESDLDAALDRLEDLYCEGEGREHALIVRFSGDAEHAIRRGDTAAFQALFPPNAVVRNHQPLSYAADDVGAVVDFGATLVGLAPRRRIICTTLECRGTAGIAQWDDHVTDASGGETVTSMISVCHFARGRQDVMEIFSPEQKTEARARFEELAREPSHAAPDNIIVGKLARLAWLRRYERGPRLTNAAEELWADDAVLFDHRSGAPSEPIHGRDALIASVRATLGVFNDIQEEPVAVRGEQFALMHTSWVADGFDSSMCALHEADADGRIVRTDFYDESDLATGLMELDARNYARLGPVEAATIRAGAALADATNRFDLDQVRGLLAPGFVFVDHMPLGFGAGDADRYMEMFELTRDRRNRSDLLRTLDVIGSVLVSLSETEIEGPQGGDFIRSQCAVLQCTPDGRISRMEWYADSDYGEAVVRARQLAALGEARRAGASPLLTNSASRVWAQAIAASGSTDDFDALGGLVAPDFRLDDRAPVVNLGVLDAAGSVKALSAAREQGHENAAPVTIAIRGDRLALSHTHSRTPNGDETGRLCIAECDDQGRLLATTIFGDGDVAAAEEELDARYLAGEGAEHADLLREHFAGMRVFQAQDFDGVRERLAPDFVWIDHRELGWGTLDIEAFFAQQQSYADLQHAYLTTNLLIEGRAVLASIQDDVVTPDGISALWQFHTLAVFDGAGRCARMEAFADDDWEAAFARFHELGAAPRDERSPRVENAATRASLRLLELGDAGRYDEAVALFRPDFVRLDRRRTVAAPPIESAAQYIESIQAILNQFDGITVEPIAVRGERLHLSRTVFATESGFETVFWHIAELDDDGLICSIVNYDEDDLVTARMDLDDRYAVDEGVAHAIVLRGLMNSLDAYNASDIATMAAGASPEFNYVDHRQLGWGELDARSFTTMAKSFTDVDAQTIVTKACFGERTLVGTLWTRAVSTDGLEGEFANHIVFALDESGRALLAELFDDHEWEAALARFDELSAEPLDARSPRVENAATALAQRWLELTDARRFDEARRLMRSDFVRVDHRSHLAYPAITSADDYMAWHATSYEHFDSITSEPIAVRGERLALNRTTLEVDGGFASTFLMLSELGDDGLWASSEIYDEADIVAALRELDERYAEGVHATDPRTPGADNDANRELARFWHALGTGEEEAWVPLMGDDVVLIDRRRAINDELVGRDANIANLREAAAIGVRDVETVPIAARGAALGLLRISMRFGNFESKILQLSFPGGAVTFDADDLARALAELDERYLEGDGRDCPGAALSSRGVAAANRRDWPAVKATCAPNFVCIDHSPVAFPPATAAQLVDEQFASLVEAAPDATFVMTAVYASAAAVLASMRVSGHTSDGSEYEWLTAWVGRIGADGLFSRFDAFQIDQWDDALALFDELASTNDRHPRPENVATYLNSRYFELVEAGRHDESNALIAPEYSRLDRRRTVSAPTATSRNEIAGAVHGLVDVGFTSFRVTPIAVRGEHTTLGRAVATTNDGNEIRMLAVDEVNDRGLAIRSVYFDDDDLAGAIDELGAQRAADGQIDAEATALAMMSDFNRRDWDAFTARLAPDFVAVDHSAVGFPQRDRDTYVHEQMETFRTLLPRAIGIPVKVFASERTVVLVIRTHGTSTDGAELEWEIVYVNQLNRDGLVESADVFQIDQWSEALARFDELAARADDPLKLSNLAVRRIREYEPAFAARDWDAIANFFAVDVVNDDRRSSVSSGTGSGRETIVELIRGLVDVGFTTHTHTAVAIRGERLALVRRRIGSANEFALELLAVIEFDDAGRLKRNILFDKDDIAGALQELEDRYCAGEGREHALTVRRLGDFERAFRARNWDAFADCFAPDVVSTDHRHIGFGNLDRDGIVSAFRSIVDEQPDHSLVFHDSTVRGDVAMSFYSGTGNTTDGSTYEWPTYAVWQHRAGRIAVTDVFDIEDHASALARFNELASADPRTPAVDNECVRVLERFWWLMTFDATDRLDEAMGMLAPDIVQIDVRPGVAAPDLVGRDARLTNLGAVSGIFDRVDLDAYVAVRGERLALVQWTLHHGDFAVRGYDLSELDTEGRIAHITQFDESQLVDAIAALELRHAELRTDEPGVAERGFRREKDAFERGDWDEVRACYAPDFVAIDHRPLGFPDATLDEYLARTRELTERAPDVTGLAKKAYYSDRAALAVVSFAGAGETGSEYEWELYYIAVADEQGRYRRVEYFALDQWPEAVARFDECIL